MAATTEAPGQPRRVQLGQLNLNELAELKQNMDLELQILQSQYQALSEGRARFAQTKETMDNLHVASGDRPSILIPMTTSVYQSGVLTSKDRFTIDVGAGYFLERSYDKQVQYMNKRVKSLEVKISEVSAQLQEKRQVASLVNSAMEAAIQRAQQQTAREMQLKGAPVSA